ALDGGMMGRVWDGCHIAIMKEPATIMLDAGGTPANTVRVRFLTPTELKSQTVLVDRPEFGVLFARLRDRISTLRALYGPGPLEIDFRSMGERASRVRMTNCELRSEHAERR